MRANLIVDLAQIAANWQALDALTAVETAAVVKADAYGLGAAQVAPKLLKTGVKTFFTALAEEAVAVRKAVGPEPEIYVFSGALPGDGPLLTEHNLIPCINAPEQLTNISKNNKIALQIDSGMNRLGMEPAQIPEGLDPCLIITHLACSDDPTSPHNLEQLHVFKAVTERFSCPNSIAATGGIHLGAEFHADLTRPGIGLYLNAARLALPVIQTRIVEVAEFVGYSAAYVAETPRKIATVSAGYADGIPRIMSGAMLYFEGQPCPIVGRISMDLITVDVTDLPETPQMLDLMCEKQSETDLAGLAQTIPYEILTSLGPRYARTYLA